jgi:hypothetical protein
MTTLLQQAFDAAAKLPPEEQDLLASRVLAELAAEEDFDQEITASSAKLASLASAALAEYEADRTIPLESKPRNGAELLAYWQNEGLIGTRPDIVDASEHARALRQRAEHREPA